jgi:hypothetical protein
LGAASTPRLNPRNRATVRLKAMAEERERRDVPDEASGVEPVQGAPSRDDREFRLHSELADEAKRVITHPGEEAHRLSEELKAGEADTTPLIAITGIAIWVAVIVALVVALVVIATYFV